MNKRREAMRDMLAPIAPANSDPVQPMKPAVQSGALLSMNRAFQSLTEDAEAADVLRAQLAAGAAIIEIDPIDIESSFVKDRLDGFEGDDFRELQESLREHGQILPVLVRPHANIQGKYQLAFGHRRVEALCREGMKVKAVVRALDDDALIVAQGKENLDRKDLSFIERALFAFRLEEAGIKRETILAALGVHKGNLSTMISLARTIPTDLVVAIGSAPKIGRPRWEQLAALLSGKGDWDWHKSLPSSFAEADSNERFEIVVQALVTTKPKAKSNSELLDKTGKAFASYDQSGRRTKLVIDERVAPNFAAYLINELPRLLEKFEESGAQLDKPQD